MIMNLIWWGLGFLFGGSFFYLLHIYRRLRDKAVLTYMLAAGGKVTPLEIMNGLGLGIPPWARLIEWEQEGMVTSEWEDGPTDPKRGHYRRRFYELSPAGQEAARRQLCMGAART